MKAFASARVMRVPALAILRRKVAPHSPAGEVIENVTIRTLCAVCGLIILRCVLRLS